MYLTRYDSETHVTTPLIKLASVLKLQLKFHLLHGFVPAQY